MYKEVCAILIAASTLIGYADDGRQEGSVERRVTAVTGTPLDRDAAPAMLANAGRHLTETGREKGR